jgi:superfamily II RNA helicase
MPFCAPDTAGALERGTLTATALGRVARQINGSNELWLAIALTQPVMADLAPPQLAAVLSGIVSGDVRPSVRLFGARSSFVRPSRLRSTRGRM